MKSLFSAVIVCSILNQIDCVKVVTEFRPPHKEEPIPEPVLMVADEEQTTTMESIHDAEK